jgi:hypothetical protein
MQLHDNRSLAPFDKWLKQQLRDYHGNPFILDNHIRPQAEYWVPGARIFRLEDGYGPEFVKQLETCLDITFTNRVVDHVMRFDDLKDEKIEIDPVSRDLLAKFYHGDFARFGY